MSKIPDEIKQKIEDWLKPYFQDVDLSVCSGPIDQENRNTIQRHKRNCLRRGAEYGYSLSHSDPIDIFARKKIEEMQATIVDYDKQLVESLALYNNQTQTIIAKDKQILEQREEIARLKLLFEKEYRYMSKVYFERLAVEKAKDTWETFKKEKNL